MAKVIRVITYEGTPERLEKQLYASLREGRCPFVGSVQITVQTIHSDIEHEKIGELKRTEAIEDYTAPGTPLCKSCRHPLASHSQLDADDTFRCLDCERETPDQVCVIPT